MRYFMAFLALLTVVSSTVPPRRGIQTHSRQGTPFVHTMDGGTPVPKH